MTSRSEGKGVHIVVAMHDIGGRKEKSTATSQLE